MKYDAQRRRRQPPPTHWFIVALGLAALGACGVKTEYLVATPLVYTLGYEPGPRADRYEPRIDVFFATSRAPDPDGELPFGNTPATEVLFGSTVVRLGPDEWTADEVEEATHAGLVENPPAFELEATRTLGVVCRRSGDVWRAVEPGGPAAAPLRAAVEASPTRSLLVFVDGTKGDFYRTNALAAELRHLVGRDMPVVTFSWPSHQQIFSYAWGSDMLRADRAGLTFAALIDWLAMNSGAEHIHIVSYSAGGRVAAIGLSHLRGQHGHLEGEALRDHFKIGTALFAAADEPAVRFVDEVHAMHEVADRIVVTISADDHALVLSRVFRGQGERISHMGESGLTDEEIAALRDNPRVGFVDVSHGHDQFKVEGHGYWYRHPWVMSDVIMVLRTGAPGDQRGLDPEHVPHLWAITPEYPQRLDRAAESVLPRRREAGR